MTIQLTLDNLGWFDRVTPPGVKLGLTYAEDGFVVRESLGDSYGLVYKITDPSAVTPMPGGSYLSASVPQVARADGGRFGLSSIDVSLANGGPMTLTFTGVKVGGETVHYDFTVDNVTSSYQTVTLPSTFTDLLSLSFTGPGIPQIVFDNLVLTLPNTLHGSAGQDALTGTTGSDDIFGYGGNDVLIGGAGDDWLDGGAGDDVMTGGTGNDLYFVNTHGDQVIEAPGGGIDTVRAGLTYVLPDNVENLELLYTGDAWGTGNALANKITGNSGANTLRGYNGDDTLIGGAGNDTLDGGWGADILMGGSGLDSLRGGGDADLFLFQRAELLTGDFLLATVQDFNRAQGDHLSVANGLSVFNFIGANAFTGDPGYYDEGASSGQFRYEAISGGVRLMGDIDGDGSADWAIDVLGVTSLQTSDFI